MDTASEARSWAGSEAEESSEPGMTPRGGRQTDEDEEAGGHALASEARAYASEASSEAGSSADPAD